MRGLFLDNMEMQAIYIRNSPSTLEQGDSPVLAYFGQLKEYADQLRDLGEPLTDRQLVMQMFRGLDERFHVYILILSGRTPFPSFLECRAFLSLEEKGKATTRVSHNTALHAAANTGNSGSRNTSDNSNNRGG